MNNLSVWFSLQPRHIVRTSGSAQSASYASLAIHDADSILVGDRVHLASLDACSASSAFARIDYCEVIGLGYRVIDAIVIDSSKYAAATTAAVADVANALYHVANGMNEADLLGLLGKPQAAPAYARKVRNKGTFSMGSHTGDDRSGLAVLDKCNHGDRNS
jgi:hypothetical protein